ncbi:MAG: hypothetical protein C4291_06330 [Candidatus Dadabacteria bacterium]
MAARGLIPIGPRDLTLVLYSLTLDTNEEISREAEASLKSMPEGAMTAVLSNTSIPPELLDWAARNITSESQIQKIILNRSTSNDTIAYLAETVRAQSLIELIADNQQRILGSAAIVEALSKNPSISRSTLDKVISFFQLYLNKKGEISSPNAELFEGSRSDRVTEDSETRTQDRFDSQIDLEDIQESFLDGIYLSEDLTNEIDEPSEERRESLFHRIKRMNIGERIKLAILGNREARSILVRDSHRIVSCSVLRNPHLTDMEVILIAQSRTVDEEVLCEIAGTRKWARIYQVKVSLINNPKTPPHISLNLISHLRSTDLKALINNRNIPGVVTSTARRMVEEKKKRGS